LTIFFLSGQKETKSPDKQKLKQLDGHVLFKGLYRKYFTGTTRTSEIASELRSSQWR